MLEFFARGGGPRVVLLLHGFLGSGRNLFSLAKAWSTADKSLRLIVPDLTGHGDSPPLSADPTLDELAFDVLTVARHITDQSVRIVGHSLGGRVALQAAALDPLRVAMVTLLDITPGPVPGESGPARVLEAIVAAPDTAPSREHMGALIQAAGVPPKLVDWLLMNFIRTGTEYGWHVDRAALARLHAATEEVDLWPCLETVHVDRCIRGADSDVVRQDDVTRFQAHGILVQTLAGAGHLLHTDALEGLVNILRNT